MAERHRSRRSGRSRVGPGAERPDSMSLRHRRAISASRTSIDGEVSATRFPVAMTTDGPTRNSARTANGRRTRRVLAVAVRDLDRMRADGGLSIRQLADAAKVDPGYLSLILRGARQPTVGVLVAVASALGADMSIRAYPTTGPVIHDRIQARIVEELLRFAAPTWIRYVEVPVFRPARGFIDVVFGSTPSPRSSRQRSSPGSTGSNSSCGGHRRRPPHCHPPRCGARVPVTRRSVGCSSFGRARRTGRSSTVSQPYSRPVTPRARPRPTTRWERAVPGPAQRSCGLT